MSGIIMCGVPKDGKVYRCRCGFESDDLEDFATSECWRCLGEAMRRDEEAQRYEQLIESKWGAA